MAIINFNSISGVSTITASTSITVGDSFLKNNAIGLGATTTTGRNAGVGTATGTLIYNVNEGGLQVYNGTSWVNVSSFAATGGTESTAIRTGYKVHTFTGSGTFTVTAGSKTAELLIVAPGGGGGCCVIGDGGGGGGGAGTLYYNSSFPISPGSYTVTIPGGGGGSGTGPSHGAQGSAAVFGPITAPGGGGGGSTRDPNIHPTGGSTGGAGSDIAPNNARTQDGSSVGATPGASSPPVGFGFPGGDNSTGSLGAGGGGAGGSGTSVTAATDVGNGGPGLSYSINGTSTTYAGGGGGGKYSGGPGPAGSGGPGGGGAGGKGAAGSNGTANTGGGAGGGGMTPSLTAGGGNGGSGIVIVAYTL
jgi:hypothetical protein